MLDGFLEYTRCPRSFIDAQLSGILGETPRFFRWDAELTLYGRTGQHGGDPAADDQSRGVSRTARGAGTKCVFPFDPTEVMENLRFERYPNRGAPRQGEGFGSQRLVRRLYYAVRPTLPLCFRKYLQRSALRSWHKIPFPSWPVDLTVEELVKKIWLSLLKGYGLKRIPFIWFWPEGHTSCCIMTHDVETEVGYKFCSKIIQIERAFDIKSSFEIVPERRYQVTSAFLDEIREDGREICLHGLNHDGRLFNSETEFRERAKKINEYAAKYAAIGFRSPVMYRRLDWYDAFEFSFDMSVPNVAHLDPQQGGCCTVMPYFIGRILELPLTTTQDYSLYHILGEYSLDLWRQQIELILSRHGLISFIIHPDYTIPQRVQNLYKSLLELLARLGSDHHVWLALPRDVDAWLRQRKQMELVKEAGRWVIRGLHAQRARVAYATVEDWGMKYEVQPEPTIAQEV